MLTGNAISIADRRHMWIDAALNTILVATAYHIPLTTKETDEPKWDKASTDPEIGDGEIRSAGQQQVTYIHTYISSSTLVGCSPFSRSVLV